MQKNTAGQKWRVFAFTRSTSTPKTGDAANITATISIDGAALTGTNDVNPTELADGFYEFTLTQAETNGDDLLLSPSSVTSDIQVIGAPARIATTPVSWGDDIIQTGDSFARIGVAGVGLTNLGDSRVANLDATVSSRLAPAGTLAAVTLVNGLANDVVDSDALAASAAQEIADQVWDEVASGHTTAGTFGKYLGGAPTDLGGGADLASNLSDMAGATFSTSTDSLEAIRDRGDSAWATAAGDRLLMIDTTIATLSSQTSFTLTAGSTDDDAYNGCTIVIEDVSTSTQKAVGIVDDYTGSTKTITLLEDPGVFTIATTDKVYILAEKSIKPTTAANYHVDITSGGAVGIDWANIENPATAVDLAGTDIQLVDTCTTNTDMRGTDNALLAASAPTNFSDLAITVTTGQVTVGTNNDKTGYSISGSKTTLDALNDIAATDIVSGGAITTSGGAVSNVTTVATTTTNTDMRGTDNALLAASAPTNFGDLAITASTGKVTVGTNDDKTGYSISGSITTLDGLNDPTAAAIADAVWDEILTGASHNIATSAGRRLREVASSVIWSGTAQGSGTGTNQIQLDTGASATDNAYDPAIISIIGGTGAGQTRLILQYSGTTKTATVDRDWKVNPSTDSEFIITGDPGREHVNEGLAQGGTANTITLNALASSTDNSYVGQIVFIRSGTGADQVGYVTAYNGTTKVATIQHGQNGGNWGTTPDTTSAYVMLAAHVHTTDEVAEAVRTEMDANSTQLADILTDTGTTIPAQITALNDFDPTTDTVARVTLVDTTTVNTDMISATDILTSGDIDGYTLEETLKICLAALAGKVSGGDTTTITFRAADDSVDRIVATVDSNGNRSAITLTEGG
jgi:hypothetical protein